MAAGPSQFVRYLTGWRVSLQKLVAIWQQQRPGAVVGWRWLWSMITPLDITIENTLQGVNDWGPGSPNASTTAIPLIAQSRGLIQGEAETSAHFALRLLNWRTNGLATPPPASPQVWNQTGKTELLAQHIQQFLGNNPLVRIIQRTARALSATTSAIFVQPGITGSVTVEMTTTASMLAPGYLLIDGAGAYTVTAVVDGTHATIQNLGAAGDIVLGAPIAPPGATVPLGALVTYVTTAASSALYTTANTDGTTSEQTAAWDWDSVSGWTSDTTTYSGVQTQLFWSDLWIVIYPGEWSIAGLITPLTGQRVPAVSHDAILRIVRQWKGIYCFVRAIIFSYNAALFDPATPSHAGNPDGTWGNWAYGSVPARNIVDARYWIPPQG
jgi:hypothetical protein